MKIQTWKGVLYLSWFGFLGNESCINLGDLNACHVVILVWFLWELRRIELVSSCCHLYAISFEIKVEILWRLECKSSSYLRVISFVIVGKYWLRAKRSEGAEGYLAESTRSSFCVHVWKSLAMHKIIKNSLRDFEYKPIFLFFTNIPDHIKKQIFTLKNYFIFVDFFSN